MRSARADPQPPKSRKFWKSRKSRKKNIFLNLINLNIIFLGVAEGLRVRGIRMLF